MLLLVVFELAYASLPGSLNDPLGNADSFFTNSLLEFLTSWELIAILFIVFSSVIRISVLFDSALVVFSSVSCVLSRSVLFISTT